jgi:hypothetical protein
VHHYKLYSELTLIPLGGTTPFYTVTIDFIIDIPPARDAYTGKTCNIILVLVNKLTKYVTYIATIKDLTADSLADVI